MTNFFSIDTLSIIALGLIWGIVLVEGFYYLKEKYKVKQNKKKFKL